MALTIFRCAPSRNASEKVQYFKFNKQYRFKDKILNSSRTIKITIDLLLIMSNNNYFLYCNLFTRSN
jgi:hypothetical protein